jgi:hypothetical protein
MHMNHLTMKPGQGITLTDQTGSVPQSQTEQHDGANSWRALYHPAVILLFLFLVSVWARWDFSGQETRDWRVILELADGARERGELNYAKSLYAQAGQVSASRDDWGGLLATACGMKKLERQSGRRSETTVLLLKAMNAAKTAESRSGLVAVATAFTALGHESVASMVLSHAKNDWVERTATSSDVVSPDCWHRQP